MTGRAAPAVFALFAAAVSAAAEAPRQMAVAVAPDWNARQGHLRLFDRGGDGRWVAVSPHMPVLFGRNGLAWGRGLASGSEPPVFKREGDGRAPAGMFRIGKIYTPDASLPPGAAWEFVRIGQRDAWIDDPGHPLYNRHVVIDDPAHPPPWFARQRMRVGDPAYRWLVEIRHNRDGIVPGAGSAIFFHIRRGETRPTSGCTTMAEEDLRRLIRWLRPGADPVYVLLPRREYLALWRAWRLPPPELVLPPGPGAAAWR